MKKIIFIILILYCLLILINCKSLRSSYIYKDPNKPVEDRINDLLLRMTLTDKVSQMVQGANQPGVLSEYCLGSILSGADSSAGKNNTATEWADMYDSFQKEALSGRRGIPILYGVDAVHGFGNVYGSTVFPHNIGLGAAKDPGLMEKIGMIVAKEVSATGLDWTFGPCLTVPRNEKWGRIYEGFGEDPSIHNLLVKKYITGLQGLYIRGGEHITATAKHWVGDGGTQNGVDQGNTLCSEQELRDIHIAPYIQAIEAGVGAVMVSFSSWNGIKCHENKYLITEVLKNELGFKGFVITDWGGIIQLEGTYEDQIKKAVNAGIDMLMEPYNTKDVISTLSSLVNKKMISIERIDDAVKRILRIKFKMGLFEHPLADRSLLSSFGSKAHKEVAREAVRKSLVCLKNENILPLSKNIKSIFIAGKNANNIGNQCGGWTISWQGKSGAITPGTTILEGIQNTVSSSTRIEYNIEGTGASGYDIAVVVIGETPYTEGLGDSGNLNLQEDDINCLNNIYKANIPIIVIMVSGRPLIITEHIQKWDAFIAAWLPGTEGHGVADILFGDYDFTGKLPHSWPRNNEQIPVNIGDLQYDPLFPFGFGLDYSSMLTIP